MNEKIEENVGETSFLDGFVDFGEEDVVFAEEENAENQADAEKDVDDSCPPPPGPGAKSSVVNQVEAEDDPLFKMDIDPADTKSEIYRAKIIFGKYMQKPFCKTTKERFSSCNKAKKKIEKKDDFLIDRSKKKRRNDISRVVPEERMFASRDGLKYACFAKKSEMNVEKKEMNKKSSLKKERKSKVIPQKKDQFLTIGETNKENCRAKISHINEKEKMSCSGIFEQQRVDEPSTNLFFEKKDRSSDAFLDKVKIEGAQFTSVFNEKRNFFVLEDSSEKSRLMSFEQKGNLKKWKL